MAFILVHRTNLQIHTIHPIGVPNGKCIVFTTVTMSTHLRMKVDHHLNSSKDKTMKCPTAKPFTTARTRALTDKWVL